MRLFDPAFAYARERDQAKLPEEDIDRLDDVHDAYFERSGLYEEQNPTELEGALGDAYRLGIERGKKDAIARAEAALDSLEPLLVTGGRYVLDAIKEKT